MWYCEQLTRTGTWAPSAWADRPTEKTPSGRKIQIRNVNAVPEPMAHFSLEALEFHFNPDKERPQLKRFYVSMTWDDWPEGGSYGTVVKAMDHEEAQMLCRREMAASRIESYDADDPDRDSISIESLVFAYEFEWALVDCFELDQFIQHHTQKDT